MTTKYQEGAFKAQEHWLDQTKEDLFDVGNGFGAPEN